MQILKAFGLAMVAYMALDTAAVATPKLIPAMKSPATATYTFFSLGKLPVGTTALAQQTALQAELDLNTPKLTACIVAGDLNRTAINCGNGAIQFGNLEAYTYNIGTSIPSVVISKALKKVYLQAQMSNFFASTVGVQGDTTGRVMTVHFNQRIAQFGFLADAGQVAAPSIEGLQFLVNGQTTPIKALTAGAGTFVGVEDSAGFTDVTIIASGTPGTQSGSLAWVGDQFSILSLASF